MRLIDADAIHYEEDEQWYECVYKDDIERIPTIYPESLRPHGEWVVLTIDKYSDCAIFGCSQCKTATGILRPTWKFCPHCGARMED